MKTPHQPRCYWPYNLHRLVLPFFLLLLTINLCPHNL